MKNPVRVLIVDDSPVMQQLLSMVLSADPEIEVIGTASDPYIARQRIKSLNPDVMTLDVEMPNMDGVTFLRKIMELRPMPVVMVSAYTRAGAEVTIEALEIGAVDFVTKPSGGLDNALAELTVELPHKLKTAARARIGGRQPSAPRAIASAAVRRGQPRAAPIQKIVAIGASTGGVEALKFVLMGLPAECPPILVTQHMPPRFTAAFAERLNRECPMTVSEAVHDEIIEPSHVYIAPGSHHLKLARSGSHYRCVLDDGPPVSGHCPSVNVLFRSVAQAARSAAVGAILTGMGKDGAEGLLEMRGAGAMTIGQDEASCLVYGMPKAAFECGAVTRQCPLTHMAATIIDACAEARKHDDHSGHLGVTV